MTQDTTRRPVQGMICPACAHVDAIVEETYTRPWDAGDTIDVVVGGWISAVLISFGRTKKRLRCGRCSCQFSRTAGLFTRVFWWTVVMGLAMFIAGAVAAMMQSSLPSGSLAAVADVCTWLAGQPLVAVVLLGTLLLGVFFSAVIGHTNAAAERRHLYKALEKRDGVPVEPEQPPEREQLGRFYRR